MIYIHFIFVLIVGFLSGLVIPVVASRFGKILPADPGMVLATLWHRVHRPTNTQASRYDLWRHKWKKMIYYSISWGFLMAGLFGLAYAYIGSEYILWIGCFLWAIGLSMAVDQQYFLLPDFITIPLLFFGFGFAVVTQALSPMDSFLGATFGYMLCMLSVWVANFFQPAEFGGGDAKMVTAIGAWLGMLNLGIVLSLSFMLFFLWSLKSHSKVGAFGPALGVATMIVLFFAYAK